MEEKTLAFVVDLSNPNRVVFYNDTENITMDYELIKILNKRSEEAYEAFEERIAREQEATPMNIELALSAFF